MRAVSSGGVLVNNKRAVGREPVMSWALLRTASEISQKILSEIMEIVTATCGKCDHKVCDYFSSA